MQKHKLTDHKAEERYEFDLDGEIAVIEYNKEGDVITLTHTYVPAAHQGQGIAAELTEAVLTDAREKGLKVIPQCSYVAQYIFSHPEWEEVVFKGEEL